MTTPNWVKTPSDELRYHLKRAALFVDPSASLEKLSVACGYSAPMASRIVSIGRCSKKFALAVEALVGPEVVKREDLASDFFDNHSEWAEEL